MPSILLEVPFSTKWRPRGCNARQSGAVVREAVLVSWSAKDEAIVDDRDFHGALEFVRAAIASQRPRSRPRRAGQAGFELL